MDYQSLVQWLDSTKQRINWGTPVIPLVEFAEVRQEGYSRALRGYDVQNRHGGPGILAQKLQRAESMPFVFRINIATPNPRLYSLAFVGTHDSVEHG